MRIKKKLIFFIFGVCILSALAALLSLKLYFFLSFDENVLKNAVTGIFKKNLNKAVKFEYIYIDFTGKIVIVNFNLSNSNDFNDNLNLIHSKEVILDIELKKLLNKDISFRSINFITPTITVLKKSRKSYSDTIHNLLIFKKNIKDLLKQNQNMFIVKFNNGRFVYKEIFKNKKLNIVFDKFDAEIILSSNKIDYTIDGESRLYKSKKIKNGKINIKGYTIVNDNYTSNISIRINNLDLSYFNPYIKEHKLLNISITGGITSKTYLSIVKDKFIVKGDFETNGLNIINILTPQYKILNNKKIHSDFNVEFYKGKNQYKLIKLKLFDDIFKITTSGAVINTTKQKKVNFIIDSNEIDLYSISSYFTPIKDITYEGKLKFNGNLDFDFNNVKSQKLSIYLNLDHFSLNWFTNGIKKNIVSNCNLKFSVENKSINIKGSTNSRRSDFKFSINTEIKNWMPLKSRTEINMESKNIEGGLIAYSAGKLINNFFKAAYIDDKKGYELINFLQTPMSEKLNNNNIIVNYFADSILFGENAKLNKLIVKSEMINSNIRIKEFSLSGYDGLFSFGFSGLFNRDYPFIFSKGYIKNFNFEKFSNDYGAALNLTGTGFFEYEFKLNAFRLSHLLLNSEGSLTFNILNGSLIENNIQKKINNLLWDNGYNVINLNNMNFSHFTVSFNQRGKHFWFTNFSLNSNKINFSSSGKYDYNKGINIKLYSSIFNNDKTKLLSVPFVITGELLNPEVFLKDKKDKKKIELFNIH